MWVTENTLPLLERESQRSLNETKSSQIKLVKLMTKYSQNHAENTHPQDKTQNWIQRISDKLCLYKETEP